MLSDEERKAIEYVKNIKSWWWDNSPDRIYSINRTDIEQFDIVLNLIKRLQKEIECDNLILKRAIEIKDRQSKEIEELKEKNKKYTIHFTDKQYSDAIKLAQSVAISMFEDKIKAKIKKEDELFFKTKDIRHAIRYKAYKELLEKE